MAKKLNLKMKNHVLDLKHKNKSKIEKAKEIQSVSLLLLERSTA